MPEPIDLSTRAAITNASARAIELRADVQAGAVLSDEDLRWALDMLCAALPLAEPLDMDLPDWLNAVDDILTMPLPTPPDWLLALQDPE